MNPNPYLAGLDLVQQHYGTSGQMALAKCILSLYNPEHAFSIGEILGPLDSLYTKTVLAMIEEYSVHGETSELREAGSWVYERFPGLVELSEAMIEARYKVRKRWEEERERERLEEEREHKKKEK